MGTLRDPDTGELRHSTLLNTKYLPSLNGVVWQNARDGEGNLDKSLQLFFRRHRIDFQILKHPSDPKTKYDLFQRLNRGGAYANEQEVRTCSMVLADPEFTRLLRDFAARQDFERLVRVTDDQRLNQRGLEYIVRLIVHTYEDFPRGRDVQEYLDQAILRIMEAQEPAEVLGRIGWVVETLYRLFGDAALIPPDERLEGIAPRFSLRALEGIAVGLMRNTYAITNLPNPDEFITDRVNAFWQQPEVGEMSASGLRGSVRLQRTVAFGATWFDPNA